MFNLGKRSPDDWLTPMLIKELRQELRARSFVNIFMWLQLVLILSVLMGVLGNEGAKDQYLSKGMFWLALSFPLILQMPVRGFQIFAKENSSNALELIYLTRLTAMQVMVGKWLGLFVEGALFLVALLPYVFLQYFLGGINLLTNLFVIVLLLFVSAFLIALTICGSASAKTARSPVLFVIILGIFGLPSLGGIPLLIDKLSGMRPTWNSMGAFVPGLLYCPILILLMLEIGAARIAPIYENHSFRKRSICLLLLVMSFILYPVLGLPGKELVALVVGFFVPVCVGALCESPRWLLSMFLPYQRFGALGRAAGRIFYPGWYSGFWFCVVMLFLTLLLLWSCDLLNFEQIKYVGIACAGALFFPVPATRILFPLTRRPLACYIGIHLFLLIFSLIVLALGTALHADVEGFFYFVPTTSVFTVAAASRGSMNPDEVMKFLFLTCPPALGSILVLFFQAGDLRQRTLQIEREAAEFLRDERRIASEAALGN